MPRVSYENADEGVDRDADEERHAPGHPDRSTMRDEGAGDRGQYADQGADRDVDMARDDHDRHADSRDRDIAIAREDADEVVRAEEARVDGPHHDEERQQSQEDHEFLAMRLGGAQHPGP